LGKHEVSTLAASEAVGTISSLGADRVYFTSADVNTYAYVHRHTYRCANAHP
jgi:hypothetical protein